MNTLISCAGRRTTLVSAFKTSTEQRGTFVVAADADRLAPALFVAHRGAILPRVTDPTYADALIRLVRSEGIRLLVPTIDTELPLIAGIADELRAAGCTPAISSAGFISICSDKWLTYKEFSSAGIRVPRSWIPGLPGLDDLAAASARSQLFVKPRDGSASQHTFVTEPERLAHTLSVVPNPIIQERVIGEEVTVDAFADFAGRLIHYVPRLRIRTVGGESIQGVTLPDDEFREWLRGVLSACVERGAAGPLTVQFFKTAAGPVLSEINPRFGGGFPLALAAGADYPEWLMQIVEGKTIPPRLGQYRAGLYMSRFYQEAFVSAPFPHSRGDD